MAYNEEVTMMMSVVPGSLTGISALMGGLSSINNVFTDMTRQVDANFGLVNASIITAATIVGQFGINAAKSFGEFEQGLKVAQMVSGQTAQEMDYLRSKANEFSVSYRTDIDQITEGLQTLGRAGLNTASEQTEVLENGLSTAKLEGRELNSVLEELIQNTALLGGNLKKSEFGEDSGYVNDLLVATSMTAPITTHDVSETLKYSGGIAAAAGARIRDEQGNEDVKGKAILEDYMGAIAAFAQKGVTGSIAGTALRAFFNKPATQDSSVTEALAQIHLKPEYLWEDDEETMKPVSEQIRIIKDQMEDLDISTMDQLQIWSKIVGGKMGQQMMKLDSSDIKELTSDIRAADDAGSLAAGTFQTFQSKMKETSEQGQVAFRQFGEYAAIALTPLLDMAKRIFEFFSNPIVSAGAFIGSFALIISAIRRVKDVFREVREEMKVFFHYMATGEHLMAVRPSTIRKSNRFGKDNLERKYPGQSLLTAYQREKQSEVDENILKNYKNKDEAVIMRSALKLRGTKFLDSSSKLNYNRGNLFPSLITDAPDNLVDDSYVVKTLLENNLWKDEYTKTFYKYGGNLEKTMAIHNDEMKEDIYNLNQKRLEEYNRTKVKQKKEEIANRTALEVDKIDKQKRGKTVGGGHYLFGEADEENEKIKNKNRIFKQEEIINGFGLHNVTPLDEDKMQRDIKKRYMELRTLGISPEYSPNAYSNAKREVMNQYADNFLKDVTKQTNTHMALFHKEGTSINDMLDTFVNQDLISQNPDFIRMLRTKIEKQIDKERDSAFKGSLKNIEKTLGDGESLKDIGMLSRDEFRKRTKNSVSSLISYDDMQKYVLAESKLEDPFKILQRRTLMSEIISPQKLLSNEDMSVLFPREYKNLRKTPEWENFISVSSGIERKRKEKDKNEEWEIDNAILKKRADSAKRKAEKQAKDLTHGYWEPGELTLKKSQLDDKSRFFSLDNIKETVKKVYGDRAPSVDGIYTRSEMDKAVYPYFANWRNLDKKGEGNTNLLNFAKELGIVYEKGKEPSSKNNIIGDINKKLTEKEVNKQVLEEKDTHYQKIYNDLNKIISLLDKANNVKNVTDKQIEKNEESVKKSLEKEKRRKQKLWEQSLPTYDYDTHHRESKQRRQRLKGKETLQPYKDRIEKEEKEKEKRAKETVDNLNKYNQEFEEKREKRQKSEILNTNVSGKFAREKNLYDITVGKEDDPVLGLEKVKQKAKDFTTSISDGLSSLKQSISRSLNADRSDSLLDFGKGSKANKALNVIDMLGGPFAVATGAATAAMELLQMAFQSFCEELKKAEESLSEAYSNLSAAEDTLERKYREGNPDATDDEIDQMMYDTYAQMEDDMANAFNNGSEEYFKKLNTKAETGRDLVYDEEKDDGTTVEKEEEIDDQTAYEEAIRENTGALYSATAELGNALDNYTRKATDSWWGVDGKATWLSDQFGGFVDKLNSSDGNGSTFTEKGNQFLLTQSQADENYAGYKEMAGLMLEDFKDANGNWIKGLRTMMGKDVEMLANIIPKGSWRALKSRAEFASRLGPQQNMKIQQSMKNDPKTWKKLGKELAKRDVNKKAGRSTDKNIRRINGMISKLNSSMKTGFRNVDIMQAAYLQQMQDMYQVAQQSIVPIIAHNAQTAASTLYQASNIGSNVSGTGSNTGGTYATAGVIAGLVAIIAKTEAAKASYQTALEGSQELGATDVNGDGQKDQQDVEIVKLARQSDNADDFYKKAMEKYDLANTSFNTNQKDINQAAGKFIAQNYEATALMTGYGYDAKTANEQAQRYIEDTKGMKMSDILNTAAKNYTENPRFRQALIDNYLASDDGDGDGSGGGGGGGDGGGSGSGDKDNTGTKKERVDLVLCNKKEIPKLNVNLFKKPPSFTVLNKNFKLRDVKINTEDKPKAIMSSIKNAFIDVQKRSDPKIIQDEEGVYDPEGATDGNALPSGSAKTKTDSQR